MMKKYLLPTLASLTLSGYVIAQDMPPPPAVPEVPMTQQSEGDNGNMGHCQEMMTKWKAHKEEMQALWKKLGQASTQEEWQSLQNEMQQHRQQMQEEMREQGGMSCGHHGPGPRWGKRPGWGGPAWGGPRGPQGSPFDKRGGMPPQFNKEVTPGGPFAKIDERLENIENLLKEVVELLKEKQK